MKNKFLITFLCIGTSFMAKAQTQSDSSNWVLDFGGSVGLFIPFNQVNGEEMLIGTTSTTSVQFNYKRHFFARLQFGEISAEFKYKTTLGPIKSAINSNTNSLNLALDIGYQSRLRKWQPLVYAGAGPSYVFIPAMTHDINTNTVSYTTNESIQLYMNAGAGVNYYLSKSVILVLELQTSTVLNLPQKPSANLTGISALVNIKITL